MQFLNPANYPTTNSYIDVPGAIVDTLKVSQAHSEKLLSFQLAEVGTTNGVTVKVVASNDNVHFVDIIGCDENGTTKGAAAVAIAASATTRIVIAPTTAMASFRYYKLQALSTVGGASGTLNSAIVAK